MSNSGGNSNLLPKVPLLDDVFPPPSFVPMMFPFGSVPGPTGGSLSFSYPVISDVYEAVYPNGSRPGRTVLTPFPSLVPITWPGAELVSRNGSLVGSEAATDNLPDVDLSGLAALSGLPGGESGSEGLSFEERRRRNKNFRQRRHYVDGSGGKKRAASYRKKIEKQKKADHETKRQLKQLEMWPAPYVPPTEAIVEDGDTPMETWTVFKSGRPMREHSKKGIADRRGADCFWAQRDRDEHEYDLEHDLVSPCRFGEWENDVMVSDDEDDLGEDGPFDRTDENRICRLREEAEGGGSKKKRKKVSKISKVSKANSNLWAKLGKHDRPSQTVKESEKWSLLIFTPKSEEANSALYQREMVLADRSKRRKLLAPEVIAVQRGGPDGQVYGARRLDISWHGALGPEGVHGKEGLVKKYGFRVLTIPNTRNSKYDEERPLQPVVHNGGSFVKRISGGLINLLRNHLPEILGLSETDPERLLKVFNVGITPVQGKRWWDFEGLRLPGTMASGDNLSVELGQSLGALCIDLVDGFRKESFAGTDVECFPKCPYMDVFLKKLSEQLHMPPGVLVPAPGIAFVLGNSTSVHLDTMNDWRKGHDWTVLGSVTVKASEYMKAEWIKLLEKENLEPDSLSIMMIVYSRASAGGRCDIMKYGADNVKSPCAEQFLADMKTEEWQDVDLLQTEDDVAKWYHLWLAGAVMESAFGPLPNGCSFLARLEAATKLFWYSVFLDVGFRLLLNLDQLLGRSAVPRDVLALIVFFSRECRGQWVAVKVIMDLLTDPQCLERAVGTGPGCKRCLLRILERQLFIWSHDRDPPASRPKKNGNNWPKTGPHSRLQSNVPLLYQCEADRSVLEAFLDNMESLLKPLMMGDGNEEVWWERAKCVHRTMRTKSEYNGLGHLKAMHVLHIAALFGYILPFYGNVAFVSEDRSYGPGCFFDQYNKDAAFDDETGLRKKIAVQFEELCRDVQKDGRGQYCARTCESYSCGRGRNERKMDLIVFHKGKHMQVLANVVHRSTNKKEPYRIELLMKGKWRPLREIMTPVYEMKGGKKKALEFFGRNSKTVPSWLKGYDQHQLPYAYSG